MLKQRVAVILHAIATVARPGVLRLNWWERWTARTRPTDYKGWRIIPTSYFSPGKGWSPDVRIAALDADPPVEQHFPQGTQKFFKRKADADGYATNMGIALVDTALGGWRIPTATPAENQAQPRMKASPSVTSPHTD